MPELPEVETTCRGIKPHITDRQLSQVRVRQDRLRWPVTPNLQQILAGQTLHSVSRRAKYLLLGFDSGTLLIHLGMSGSLRVLPDTVPAGKHDHVDLVFSGQCLRFHDPRRFGAILWTAEPAEQHQLLLHLGPEPLDAAFNGVYLHQLASRRRTMVKNLLMDGRVVVGIGNIYANESLFQAGILPQRQCQRIALQRYQLLATCVKQVLAAAIEQGGTTLQDFQQVDGKPGYFAQQLQVYGRTDMPCPRCGDNIRHRVIGQRSSFYCPGCQR